MTTGLPFDDIRNLIKALPAADAGARSRADERSTKLSAQGPSLGRLGDISGWLAAWTGRDPSIVRPLVALFAGTHGGVAGSREKTQAMVEHAAAGGALVCQLCAANDLGLKVFDLALHIPAGDITETAALDERACAATMAFGMEAIAGGIDLVCVGAIGVGGALSAAALLAALHGGPGSEWSNEHAAAVDRALVRHEGHLKDPLEALRRLGGREIAAMAGTILAARMEKIPVILDGYASLAAAAVLKAAAPSSIDHCLLGHVSTQKGMARAAEMLGLSPLLDLSLGDGEGAGAAIAAGIVKNAAAAHSGMALLPQSS